MKLHYKNFKPIRTTAQLINADFFTDNSFSAPLHIAAAILLAATCLAPFSTHAAQAAQPAFSGSQSWAKGRILVLPRAGLSDKALANILAPHGGKTRKIGQSSLYIVDLPPYASEKAVAAVLARNPHLKFAEVDQRVSVSFTPNDPYYGSQWHLAKIGASSAWDYTQGAGVTIAILDTGVESTHPDLAAQMVPGWNFYDNNVNTSDVHGHGTKVAGTAAASSNNNTGVGSVAGAAKIMPIRVSDATGYAYYSTIAQGLTWAADQGVRVANVSFDGVARSSAIQTAAQYMKDKGGLVVVGTGNNGINETIAETTTMIPVSATNSNDAITSWSSFGNFVAVAAPGEGIWTTQTGGTYSAVNGTSFASPLTAGVVALMMAGNSSLPNSQIEKLLFSTTIDLGSAGRDVYFGYGRVNAAAAVQAAVTATPDNDTQAPTVAISAPLNAATVSGLTAVNVTANDNVGVTRVELRANGTVVAIDTTAPFGFSWDTTGVPNGMANLTAHAFDAAGNTAVSATVAVNVANTNLPPPVDTIAPIVTITNPVAGTVTGNVAISVNASDNSAASGITQTIYIDGIKKASGTGATLSYNWNTRKITKGLHTIQAVAKDAAGNASSASVIVQAK